MFHGIRAFLADLVRAAGSAGAVRRLAVTLAFSLVALPAMAQTWTATPDVSTGVGAATNAQVKVDATGVATAVWEQSGRIYASRNAGSGWSTPEALSSPIATSSRPRLAVDSTGVVTVVWIRDQGGNTTDVQAIRYSAGNWGQPVVLSSSGYATIDASVTVDSNNVVTAVWSRFNGDQFGGEYVVQASRYSGGQWSITPVNLSDDTRSAYNAQMAVDSTGNVIFVWIRSNGTHFIVQTRRWNGSVLSGTDDLSATGEFAQSPQVTVDSANAVTIVWSRGNGSNSIIQARRWTSGGGWGGVADLSAAGVDAYVPQVTADSANVATVVWTRNSIIQASRWTGAAWSATPYDVSLGGTTNADAPQVTVDGANIVTAVWLRSNGTNRIVQASRFTGTSWSTPADLSTTGQNASAPQVAVNSAGVATAVWTRAGIIQASRFAAPAPPAAPVPTLSEWAMILFGLMLAGGAAVMIQRRRQVA